MSSSKKKKHGSSSSSNSSSRETGGKTPSSSTKPDEPANASARPQVTLGTTSTDTTSVISGANDGAAFIAITPYTFKKFQRSIFPILTAITMDPVNVENDATMAWYEGLHHTYYKLDEETSFTTIKKIFAKISDLQGYRKFVLSFPRIQDYIATRNGTHTTGGFDFRVKTGINEATKVVLPGDDVNVGSVTYQDHSDHVNTNVDTMAILDSTDVDHHTADADITQSTTGKEDLAPTTEDGYLICCGTNQDFVVLMTQVWIIMNQNCVAHPDDYHSTMWLDWEKQGIQPYTTYQQAKVIMGLDSLFDMYCYIHDCLPITTRLEVKWNNKILSKLHYGVQDISNPSPMSERSVSETTLNDMDSFTFIDETALVSPVTPIRTNITQTLFRIIILETTNWSFIPLIPLNLILPMNLLYSTVFCMILFNSGAALTKFVLILLYLIGDVGFLKALIDTRIFRQSSGLWGLQIFPRIWMSLRFIHRFLHPSPGSGKVIFYVTGSCRTLMVHKPLCCNIIMWIRLN